MAGIIRNLTPILGMVIVGSLIAGVALSILGVVLVYIGATGNTELSFFGQTFKSANVGIGAFFLGAALIVLVVRRALKSVDRAVHAESRSQQPRGGEGSSPEPKESAAGGRDGATVVAPEELKRLVTRLSSDIVLDRGSLLHLLDTHREELIKGVSNWPGRASNSPFLFGTVCPRLAVYGLAFVQDIPMSVHRIFSLSREGLAVLNYVDEMAKTERGDASARTSGHFRERVKKPIETNTPEGSANPAVDRRIRIEARVSSLDAYWDSPLGTSAVPVTDFFAAAVISKPRFAYLAIKNESMVNIQNLIYDLRINGRRELRAGQWLIEATGEVIPYSPDGLEIKAGAERLLLLAVAYEATDNQEWRPVDAALEKKFYASPELTKKRSIKGPVELRVQLRAEGIDRIETFLVGFDLGGIPCIKDRPTD